MVDPTLQILLRFLWICSKMTFREYALPRDKAADAIGGIPADSIGGFIRRMCVIAQGYF